MSYRGLRRAPARLTVVNRSLPAWDRARTGHYTDLSKRIGQHVALGCKLSAEILGVRPSLLRSFIKPGIIRDARIVKRPADKCTFVCVTACYNTRFYLEFGEVLRDLTLGRPDLWIHDADETDLDGRICVRIRPRQDGAIDNMTIVTNRRKYIIKLVWNPSKVTLACSWTYPEPIKNHSTGRPLGLPGDQRARSRNGEIKRPIRFVLFRLGPDMRAQVMRWAASLVTVKAGHLRRYKEMHRRAGIPSAWKHPRNIIYAVSARALAVDSFSKGELRQWLPIAADAAAMLKIVKETAGRIVKSRVALPSGRPPTTDELVDAFPFLAELPDTCFADPDAVQMPSERSRKILWAMGPMAEYAALFCAIAPRYIRRPEVISSTLNQLKGLEQLAAAAGLTMRLDAAADVGALLDHLLKPSSCANSTVTTRYMMAQSLLLVIRILRRYLRSHDVDNARGLLRLRPADPTAFAGARARLADTGRTRFLEWRSNRKNRVLGHVHNQVALDFAADLNLEQVVLTTRALKAAETHLGEAMWIDVPVMMTIVTARGQLVIGKQQCIWRIWRADAYLMQLLKASKSKKEIARIKAHLDAIAAGRAMAPIREYRRTVGVLGSTVVEPFMVRCWRHGLMMVAADLPAHVRRRRLAVLRELKLPGHSDVQSRLLHGTAWEMGLWRISLKQNRVIAYLEPFEHALRFAHLGLSSVLENLSRATAWLQQTQDQSGWELRRLNKQPVAGFLAHDKMSPQDDITDQMSWFPVGPKHLAEAAELVQMTCDRCGYVDGLLPEIMHRSEFVWKRPEPRAWTFSFDGRVISWGEHGRYLRFLLPSRGRITFHDVRHLLANAAFAAGVPGWKIRLALNHGSTDLWLYYAQLSQRQIASIEAGSIRTIVQRSADGRGRGLTA